MLFYLVDAFASKVFEGNSAGVLIYSELDENTMQSIAKELGFSETAFIKVVDKGVFNIRFFTPIAEVSLCGHAAIASFGALLHSKYIENSGIYKMQTKSGILDVFVDGQYIMMEQSKPEAGITFSDMDELAEALGISTYDIGDRNYLLKPQIVSTGLFDIIIPVKSKEILNSISPDFEKISKLSNKHNVVGMHVFTLDDESYTAACRNFAPLYGIDEESATGTASGALTYYLYINKVLKELDRDYTFIQGVKMNRPSKITTRLIYKDKIAILCGGAYSILASGCFYE